MVWRYRFLRVDRPGVEFIICHDINGDGVEGADSNLAGSATEPMCSMATL